MKENKYFLFPESKIHDFGVIIREDYAIRDSGLLALIQRNFHGFKYYLFSNESQSTKDIIVSNSISLYYFRLFINRKLINTSVYNHIINLEEQTQFTDKLAINILDSCQDVEDALSLVFLLLAIDKAMLGIYLLKYIKDNNKSLLLEKWYSKIVYDYSKNHKIMSELHSKNMKYLIKKGNELYKNNEFSYSIYYLEKAVYLHDRDDYVIKLGLAYRSAYKFKEAERLFNRYISSHPDDYKGYYLRGLISLSQMKYNEALHYYEISISKHPASIISIKKFFHEKLYLLIRNKGIVKNSLPNVSYYNNFKVKSHVEYVNLILNLANIKYSLGQYSVAAQDYYLITTLLRPDLYIAYEKLFQIDKKLFFNSVRRLDKYILVLSKLPLHGNNVNIERLRKYIHALYVTRGRIHILNLNRQEAERIFQTAIDVHNNIKAKEWLAYLYLWSQRYGESLKIYFEVLKEKPNRISVVINIIRVYLEKGEIEKAGFYINRYHHLLLKNQNKDKSHLVRRNYCYAKGDIKQAWLVFRDRKICEALTLDTNINYTNNIFNNTGKNRKKSVLVLAEWGPGDEIRWASLYPEIKNEIGNLIIGCEPRLYELFVRSFPTIIFLPIYKRIRGAITRDNIEYLAKVKNSLLTQVFDSYSYQFAKNIDEVTLISDVLGELRGSLSKFSHHKGLLKTDLNKSIQMKDWLSTLPDKKINIGICWKSGLIDVARSIHYAELSSWEKIFKLKDVNFINLQYANYEHDINNARSEWNVDIYNPPINLKDDFDNVAALIENLDLIISPATAVAELSGMLGTETLLFSNSPEIDWRVREGNKDLWHSSITHIKAVRNQGYVLAQRSIVEEIYRLIVLNINKLSLKKD